MVLIIDILHQMNVDMLPTTFIIVFTLMKNNRHLWNIC